MQFNILFSAAAAASSPSLSPPAILVWLLILTERNEAFL